MVTTRSARASSRAGNHAGLSPETEVKRQKVETVEDDLAVAQRYREMFINKSNVPSSVFLWCIEKLRRLWLRIEIAFGTYLLDMKETLLCVALSLFLGYLMLSSLGHYVKVPLDWIQTFTRQ